MNTFETSTTKISAQVEKINPVEYAGTRNFTDCETFLEVDYGRKTKHRAKAEKDLDRFVSPDQRHRDKVA